MIEAQPETVNVRSAAATPLSTVVVAYRAVEVMRPISPVPIARSCMKSPAQWQRYHERRETRQLPQGNGGGAVRAQGPRRAVSCGHVGAVDTVKDVGGAGRGRWNRTNARGAERAAR